MSEVATTKAVKSETKAAKTVKIKIPRAPKGEDNFIIAGFAGKMYKIQRGVEVEVPEAIAYIIENSLAAREKADDYIDEIANK